MVRQILPMRPLTLDECKDILHLPAYYGTLEQEAKLRYLKQDYPIRLDKATENMWTTFGQDQITKAEIVSEQMQLLAERTANSEIHRSFLFVRDILNGFPIAFKNYEEMVALSTVVFLELDSLLNDLNNAAIKMEEDYNLVVKENTTLKRKMTMLMREKEIIDDVYSKDGTTISDDEIATPEAQNENQEEEQQFEEPISETAMPRERVDESTSRQARLMPDNLSSRVVKSHDTIITVPAEPKRQVGITTPYPLTNGRLEEPELSKRKVVEGIPLQVEDNNHYFHPSGKEANREDYDTFPSKMKVLIYSMSEARFKVYDMLVRKGTTTPETVAYALKKNRDYAWVHLQSLVKIGLVTKSGRFYSPVEVDKFGKTKRGKTGNVDTGTKEEEGNQSGIDTDDNAGSLPPSSGDDKPEHDWE